MSISDWSSDVCSSDLISQHDQQELGLRGGTGERHQASITLPDPVSRHQGLQHRNHQRRDQREVAEFGNHDGTTTPVSASVWPLTHPSGLPTPWPPDTACARAAGLAPPPPLNGHTT